VRNDTNLGFVKAVNQGIKVSDSEYLCIMNNDTIASTGWLQEMVAVMEANPEIGLLNPSSNTSGQFPEGRSIDNYALSLNWLKGRIQELYTCRGFCMLVQREVIDRVGLLDEIYHIGYFDDTDYCKRAQKMGFRTARAKAAYVFHRENITFKSLHNNKDLFDSNEKIFFERWGRHVRVGYFLDRIISKRDINDMAISVARQGHQMLIFIRNGLKWPIKIDHFDIRGLRINPIFFFPVSFYKILKRKRKKPIEVLLTDNALFGAFLKLTKGMHGADVLVRPQKDRLMALLAEKSRQHKKRI
jgi:cellulose synthase/poly-beta-1,6-N-acetylglucosamine synthase-like glycosyltransferase